MILLILPRIYCLLITHLNERNRRQFFSCWSPCFDFFVCSCYNKETHYPTLEKPIAQNITVCKNQGKQHKLSDHWKLKKNNNREYRKRLTEIQVLTKKFTKRVFKKIRSQINLIKFVESYKFDKAYSKIWDIFVWSNFLKIWHILIHQISWVRNIKSNFKSMQTRKDEENKTTNEST